MGVAIALLAIAGYCLYISQLVKWPIETALIFVCAMLICLLHFAGILGHLQIAAQAILGVGGVLFLREIVTRFRSGSIAINISPAVTFFLLSTAGLWILTTTENYSNLVFWDDFSHWGSVSRILAYHDRLVIPTDEMNAQDYPPGIALFEYLFFQFSEYSERVAIFAQGVFILAVSAQIFSVVPKSINRFALLGIYLLVYSLFYFIQATGLHTLSVDLVVGLVFGVGVLSYLEGRQKHTPFFILRLVPLIVLLPLIKPIALLFSFVTAGVIAGDIFLASVSGREKIKLYISVVIMISLCLFTYISWAAWIKSTGIPKTFDREVSSISAGEVFRAFNPATASERQKTTMENFALRVLHPFTVYRPHYWFALCLAFIVFIWRMDTDYKSWRKFVPFATLLAGFCAYTLVLLVLYMFIFGAYEGPILASIDRYENTYLVGVIVVLVGVSLSQYFKRPRGRGASISLVIICFFVMLPNLGAARQDMTLVIRGQKDADIDKGAKFWDVIQSKTPPDARIYFIWQESSGQEWLVFKYGAMRTTNRECSAVGEPFSDSDVWTCRMALDEFERALTGYDYLLVGHADKKFKDRFLPLFESATLQDGDLFKITKEAEHIRLRAI